MTTEIQIQPSFKNVSLWDNIDEKVYQLIVNGTFVPTGTIDIDLHYLFVLINNTMRIEFKGYQENNLDKKEKAKKAKKACLEAKAQQFIKKSKYEKPQCTIQQMEGFFNQQFKKVNEDPEKYIDWEVTYEIIKPFNNNNISKEEFDNILEISYSDSKDEYGMSYNILKHLPRIHSYICLNYFVMLYHYSLNYSEMMYHDLYQSFSKSWAKCIMEPKYKKGDSSNPINFRPIINFPIHVRIFNRILSRRLVKYLLNNKMLDIKIQKGTIDPYNGVYNHVMTIREIMQKAKSENRSAVITFLDIKNAYGSISYGFIEYMMKYYHIPKNIAGYILNFYKRAKACVRMNKEKSDFFPLETGLHQGCSLSNVIFLMAMNIFLTRINNLNQEKGFQSTTAIDVEEDSQPSVLQVIRTLLLAFVDDVVIITETMEDNQKICNEFSKMLRNCNIFLNYEKIRYLKINVHNMGSNTESNSVQILNIDDHHIKEIGNEPFYYLGSNINISEDVEFIKYLENYIDYLNKLNLLNVSDKTRLVIYNNYITRRFVRDMQHVTWFNKHESIISKIELIWLQKWKCKEPENFIAKRNMRIKASIVKHAINNSVPILENYHNAILQDLTPEQIESYSQEATKTHAEYSYEEVSI